MREVEVSSPGKVSKYSDIIRLRLHEDISTDIHDFKCDMNFEAKKYS